MKPNLSRGSLLALAGTSLLALSSASAQTYYWDGNDSASGFGTASGTWADPTLGTLTSGWSTSATGENVVDATSISTTTANAVNFGTNTVDFGLGSGTITVDGTVNSGNITFGQQTTNVTLSGGTINLPAAATILSARLNTDSPVVREISSTVTGAATSLSFAGIGGLILSSSNSSYAGFTSIATGTGSLTVTHLADGGSNSSIGASTNVASNLRLTNNTTLRYIGAAASTDRLFTINGTVAGHQATLNASGTGAIEFTNTGNIAYGTVDQTRTLNLRGTNTDANTFRPVIANNGSGAVSLTKHDAGTWVLTGTNSYTGATTINAGTLRAGAAAGGQAFGNGSAVTLADVAGATLDLNNFNQTIGSLAGGGTTGGTVSLGSATLTTGNTTATTFAGVISGTGGLTKNGAGAFSLTGSNSYTGVTHIAVGPVIITTLANGGSNSSIGASTNAASNLLIGPSATLRYDGAGGSTDRLFTLNGTAADQAANINSNGTGAIAFTNPGNLAFGTVDQTRRLNLFGPNTGDNTIAASLTNNGTGLLTVNKSGPGTWVLSGTNTNTGGSTSDLNAFNNSSGGTLVFRGAQSIQGAGTIRVNDNLGSTVRIESDSGLTTTTSGLKAFGTFNLVLDRQTSGSGAGLNFSFNNTDAQAIEMDGTSTFNISAGTNISTGTPTLEMTRNGAIRLRGPVDGTIHTINASGVNARINGFFDARTDLNRTLVFGGTSTGNEVYGAINDTTTGVYTVEKNGSGSWTFSAANSYTGATSINEGTLLINGSTSTSSAVSVGTNGTLGGTGTVGGTVTVDGFLKPGNSTGLLTVGSLNLNTGASTTFEISGTNRGAAANGYDALGVNTGGAIDFDGALSFDFTNPSTFANGTEFDLFSFTTTSTGDFSGVTSTGFYAGPWGKTGDIWSLVSGSQTLEFSEVTGNLVVIPEPRAALLGGLGLLALLRRRRV